MKKEFNRAKTPYVSFVLALATGIGSARCFDGSLFGYRLIIFLFWGLTILTLFALRSKLSLKTAGIPGFLFSLSLFLFGWISVWKSYPQIDARHFSHYAGTTFFGTVSEEPISKGHTLQLTLQVNAVEDSSRILHVTRGFLRLYLTGKDQQLPKINYGDELFFTGTCQAVPPRFDPYGFDYQAYLRNKNIWHQAFVPLGQIKKTGRKGGSLLIRTALSWRQKMVGKLRKTMPSEMDQAVLSTLVLGDRATLDQGLVDTYAATGTIHVLSVSGMHVGLVFICLSFMMRWMEGSSASLALLRLLVLLLGIWCYVFLSGLSPSALRAGCMISFLLTASVFKKQQQAFNQIAASAFFLLLYNPGYLFDVGFQLSYLAVTGLAWPMVLWKKQQVKGNRFRRWFLQYLLFSCMAQLFTFPLVLYYFHTFPVYFLIANALVSLPASLMIYGGFLLLLLPFPAVNIYLSGFLHAIIHYTNQLLQEIAHWPYATWNQVWISSFQCLLLYLFIVGCLLALQYAKRGILYLCLVSCLFLGLSFAIEKYRQYHRNKMILFNVGKDFAFLFLKEGVPLLYSNLPLTDPKIQYQLIPTVEALSSVERLIYIGKGAKMRASDMSISDNCIRFGQEKLVLLDDQRPENLTDKSKAAHWLLIRNDQPLLCLQNSDFGKKKIWILDGSNHEETIHHFVEAAKQRGIPYYILKDNFAYVWEVQDK